MRSFLRIALLCFWLPVTALAQEAPEEIVRATLVSETAGFTPGSPVRVGVLLEPLEGWHTYWLNPGDAGLATTLEWTLPEGFSASAIDWPAPERIKEGPLVIYGYSGGVLLPVTIATPAITSDAVLRLKADWLVCKDICIPESKELQLTLPANKTEATEFSYLFKKHDAAKPLNVATPADAVADADTLKVSVPLSALGNPAIATALLMPKQPGVIQYAADPTVDVSDALLTLSMPRAEQKTDGKMTGLLEIDTTDGKKQHYDIAWEIPEAAATEELPIIKDSAHNAQQPAWFPVLLLSAMLGGLILNLMPCVLPVLSLKALALVGKAGRDRSHTLALGAAYTLGIMLSFAMLAGLLIALKSSGELIGWGYQMQSPAFVGFLIYLLFLVGLNLSGLFHLPVLLGTVGSSVTDDHTAKGSFFTGILAALVATPCTAPFMATAVGIALTLPAWQSLLVFEALALGLALPFLLVSIFPQTLRFLPKPGAWMEQFKEFLAFPMYASVIWLLWVLTMQAGAGGMAIVLAGMLLIYAALWMKSLFDAGSIAYRITAVVMLLVAVGLTLPMLREMDAPPASHSEDSVPFSKDKLAVLLAQGKPVFIDATAAWCITCQLNERVAINTESTKAAFRERGITLMIADWTRRNPEITNLLTHFGKQGVPLYVYYPPNNGEPVVLPQLLTKSIVLDVISK